MTTDTAQPTPGSPQRVTLPDSLVRAITLVAADRSAPPIAALEVAVLSTFGYALYRRQESVDPRQVAIPTAQWNAICQALMDAPANAVGRVNLGLDWVNIGPAADDQPAPTVAEDQPVGACSEVAGYPVAAWQAEVAAGATRLGYTAWVTATRTLNAVAATVAAFKSGGRAS